MTTKEIIKKYLPNYKVRNVRNAKLTYSAWGFHIVQFDCNSLEDDYFVKMGIDSVNRTHQSQKEFKTKKQALEFLKAINQ